MRVLVKLASCLPRRLCEMVTALCKFTAQAPFIPSATSNTTSEGTSRIVEVIGATVTVERWPTALSRVRISTGRCLSGFSNRQRWTANGSIVRPSRSVLPGYVIFFPLRFGLIAAPIAFLKVEDMQTL